MTRLATGSALPAACRASPQQQQQQHARRGAPMQPSTSSPWSSLPPQAAAARSSNPSSRWQGTHLSLSSPLDASRHMIQSAMSRASCESNRTREKGGISKLDIWHRQRRPRLLKREMRQKKLTRPCSLSHVTPLPVLVRSLKNPAKQLPSPPPPRGGSRPGPPGSTRALRSWSARRRSSTASKVLSSSRSGPRRPRTRAPSPSSRARAASAARRPCSSGSRPPSSTSCRTSTSSRWGTRS